jgi:hypothetical protein
VAARWEQEECSGRKARALRSGCFERSAGFATGWKHILHTSIDCVWQLQTSGRGETQSHACPACLTANSIGTGARACKREYMSSGSRILNIEYLLLIPISTHKRYVKLPFLKNSQYVVSPETPQCAMPVIHMSLEMLLPKFELDIRDGGLLARPLDVSGCEIGSAEVDADVSLPSG